ncbi:MULTISPECIES: manganese catalase family protein [Cytobacillus]|jgi:Mn-containing catalase|uniref:Manganese catalase n=3 Tax=Cytobacillus TaxID=2675230 RepID=A0A160M750_9BACI|nr:MULTISPECIES: manganese catalase family protein [Cytobacillus]EFV74738.1 Mn-containing catalase [Bacillus sp. 2_A_57_CT2]MBY0158079.1 manganese catalase family protein [Cytobacillus firmus]AND38023.1 manganese catalase [Cytobacillus oceanisediminis 2691]MBU8733381.1 manganese catalase family protein [Cytobacillus oceanisediminis]MCM3394701.1 manganese catalase family protein [Cytobacillus oceanisediminis]
MFFHVKELQFEAKPERPDPVFAKKLQELIGGQYGEMTVAMQYMFQGWATRGNEKYRDLLLDIGTEEIGHVEMLATMVARLMDDAPVNQQQEAAKDPVVGAIMGGMNPQHAIVSGLGARPTDSVGNPWMGTYITASGNLLADFRSNLNAESQGRLQAARLYEMTDDKGIKELLSVLIARDAYHQNQWAAAIAELEEKEGLLVPSTFPREKERTDISYTLYNLSAGEESSTGRWAQGPALDGQGEYKYVGNPKPEGDKPMLKPAPPNLHNTLPMD